MKGRHYGVWLPTEGVNVRGYSEMPTMGATHAESPKDAVGHFVFGWFGEDKRSGRLVIGALKKLSGDLGRFVAEVPDVESGDGSALPLADRVIMQEYALAQEFWKGKGMGGRPSDYFIRVARKILNNPF